MPIPANATLTWDAENRLAKAVVNGATIHYEYDHQSRLITRTEGSATVRYLYDGWNRIAEYGDNGSGLTLGRCYLWGMDMSGSMQGAGGVGGLLSMSVNGTSSARFYPTYDGNGNVSEYVNQSGGKEAHFEYDPFGNLTVDSEDNAEGFPYRFSSKPQDPVTGLYYYGYRFYDPVTSRWPSRDPIEEAGGVNLYGFVKNSSLQKIDILGLKFSGENFWLTKKLRKAQDEANASPIEAHTDTGEAIEKLISTFKKNYFLVDVYSQGYTPNNSYNWLTDTFNFKSRSELLSIYVHETVHMYNDFEHFSFLGNFNADADEGIAYSVESIYTAVVEYPQFFRKLARGEQGDDCKRITKISKSVWKSMWDGYQYGGSRVYDDTQSKPLTTADFSTAKSLFGIQLSCQKIADLLNNLPIAGTCCIRFSCDESGPEFISINEIIYPGIKIHESLR